MRGEGGGGGGILPHFINKTKFDRFIDPFASINLPETWNLAQQISSNGTGEGSELYEQYTPADPDKN